MNQEERKLIIQKYIEAYNTFDIDAMLSLFHSGCQFENYNGNQLTASANGLSELRKMMEQGRDIFSSRKQTVTEFVFEVEIAVVEISYKGRLKVDLPNGLKAGNELNLQGCSKFEFQDGLIKNLKDYS